MVRIWFIYVYLCLSSRHFGDGHPPIFGYFWGVLLYKNSEDSRRFPSWDDQQLGEASISEPARADSLKPMKLSDQSAPLQMCDLLRILKIPRFKTGMGCV